MALQPHLSNTVGLYEDENDETDTYAKCVLIIKIVLPMLKICEFMPLNVIPIKNPNGRVKSKNRKNPIKPSINNPPK